MGHRGIAVSPERIAAQEKRPADLKPQGAYATSVDFARSRSIEAPLMKPAPRSFVPIWGDHADSHSSRALA